MIDSHEAEIVFSYFFNVYPERCEEGPEALTLIGVPHGLADAVWAQWLADEPYHDRMLEDGQVMRNWVDATVQGYHEQDPYMEQDVVVELYRASSDTKLEVLSYLSGETEQQLLDSIVAIQLVYEGFEITEVRDMDTGQILPLPKADRRNTLRNDSPPDEHESFEDAL